MPRLVHALPKLRLHRASGQAVVSIAGREIYLGPHGSPASVEEYNRVVGEWVAEGRPAHLPTVSDITVVELAAAYVNYAKIYYRKDGRPTGTAESIQRSLQELCKLYGRTTAISFGPRALKAMQQRFIGMGHSRRYVNDNVDRIRRCFRWAVSEELIPPHVYDALRSVPGLRKGRSGAREAPPITPVDDEVVDATLDHLSAVVADMVRFQRITGARPAEVCILRPVDLDRSKSVWTYRPAVHKTEHLDRERIICIGPRAQAILEPYLGRSANSYCFSPCDAEEQRRAIQHAQRRVPLKYGNRPGTNRKKRPRRKPGASYTTDSYRRAIHRAVDAANKQRQTNAEAQGLEYEPIPQWSPNQLRHAAATELRRRFGIEASRVVLGHSEVETTQIYAERDLELAKKIAKELG